MLSPEELEKCHFVPMDIMRKVIEIAESPEPITSPSNICKRNLASVQALRNCKKVVDAPLEMGCWKTAHQLAVCKAVYSHDWDKLLCLLKKCPPWDYNYSRIFISSIYYRALTILLMYHPTSQAKGLLNDFLHMVWSCRSDEDKKAILKVILSLPDRIYGRTEKQSE